MDRFFDEFSFYYKKIRCNNPRLDGMSDFISTNSDPKLPYKQNRIKDTPPKSNILNNNYSFLS